MSLAKLPNLKHKTKKHTYYVKEFFDILQHNTKLALGKFSTFNLHGFVLTAEGKPVN